MAQLNWLLKLSLRLAGLRLKRHIYCRPFYWLPTEWQEWRRLLLLLSAAVMTMTMTMTSLMDVHFISFRRRCSDVINPTSIMLCHTKHADSSQCCARRSPSDPANYYIAVSFPLAAAGRARRSTSGCISYADTSSLSIHRTSAAQSIPLLRRTHSYD